MNIEEMIDLEKDERNTYLKSLTRNELTILAHECLDRIEGALNEIAMASGHPSFEEFYGNIATTQG